jgi:hypothetical protein
MLFTKIQTLLFSDCNRVLSWALMVAIAPYFLRTSDRLLHESRQSDRPSLLTDCLELEARNTNHQLAWKWRWLVCAGYVLLSHFNWINWTVGGALLAAYVH